MYNNLHFFPDFNFWPEVKTKGLKVVCIAGHGNVTWSRDWMASLQWKPLDINVSQTPSLHLAKQLLTGSLIFGLHFQGLCSL